MAYRIDTSDENLRHGASEHFFAKLLLIEAEQRRLAKVRERILKELIRRNSKGTFW